MTLRFALIAPLLLTLTACSHGHGVYRTLSFETEFGDFTCINQALVDLGYETRPDENGVGYYAENFRASFWRTQNKKGDTAPAGSKILHSVNFGSPPASCKDVTAAGERLEAIEPKVLAACNLAPIDIDIDKRCSKRMG